MTAASRLRSRRSEATAELWNPTAAPAAPAGPVAADDVTVPAHDRFRSDQKPQSPAPQREIGSGSPDLITPMTNRLFRSLTKRAILATEP